MRELFIEMKRRQEQFTVQVRFYEELNDFLPPSRRKRDLVKTLNHRTTVKDVIESFRVPHTEVDLILVNGDSVDFDFLLKDKDRISVYPVFESLDVTSLVRLQERPLRDLKFVADVHLGKLVRLLRLLGFDTFYRNHLPDADLLRIMEREHRVLLTRDRPLLMHRVVTRGYWLRSQDPYQQVLEVLKRFDLWEQIHPYHRCMRCNDVLVPVSKKEILDRLEPKTKKYYSDFVQCSDCKNVYWKGSHYTRLNALIRKIRSQNGRKES